jgi:hypothetical protein
VTGSSSTRPRTSSLPTTARSLDDGGQADAYYGNFILFVYPSVEDARAAVRRRGRWSSYGAGFYASQALDNVVVQSTFERRRTDAAWGRLIRALRAAQDPAAPELPVQEQLCADRGVELDSGPTGTCKRGPQQVAIRARGMGLSLPGIAIEDVSVRRGPRFAAGPLVDEAKGVFVELSFEVRNTGDVAIDTRPSFELVVDGRRFEEHNAVYGLRDRYPLRPGESDRDVTLFDVPRALAGEALQRAALEVPGDPAESFSVADGHVVGHLRLAGPVGRLHAPPEPAPAPLPEPPPLPEPDPELDPGLEPA